MQPTLDVIAPLAGVLQNPLKVPLSENMEKLVEMFPDEIDADVLQAMQGELEVF